jgi:copper transport protein
MRTFAMSLRVLAVGVLAVAALVAGAGPAFAHADLVGTEPGYGAALAPGADRALLRFNYPVEVAGAVVKLERTAISGTPRTPGTALKVGKPTHPSPDHREVAVPLEQLGAGSYVLSWFLFGKDGDVMGGELAFQVPVAGAAAIPDSRPAGASPGRAPVRLRSSTPLSTAQDAARLVSFMALAVLLGGLAFVAGLWRAGARLPRTRLLLWGSLAAALIANTLSLGLKGAAVQGRSALAALSPSALAALDGTHIGRVLVLRLGFLLLAVPVVAYLTLAPERAVRSHRFVLGAAASGLGALATHGMLSHAFNQGPFASAVAVVHVGAVAVWLGGLTMLAVVVLPRRRGEELSLLVPRWSRLAFASMATAVAAGPVLLILVSPRWTALPTSNYGRFLLLKMVGVAGLLVVANRARGFARRRLPGLLQVDVDLVLVEARVEAPHHMETPVVPPVPVAVGVGGGGNPPASSPLLEALDFEPELEIGPRPSPTTVEPAALRPFVNAVALELTIAASILATTAIIVGRPPPV